MVRWLKRVAVLVCSIVALSTSVWADNPYSVYIDGAQLPLTTDPVNVDGSLLVPMRDLFQGLGAQVTWDEGSNRVFAVKDKMLLILPINNDYAYFNQRSVKLTVQARLIDERTYVPLRFVSTIFGSRVDYDPLTNRIDIVTQTPPLDVADTQRLAILSEAVANTNEITRYESELQGRYDVTLGQTTVSITLQALARVAGQTEMDMNYKLMSSATPASTIQGDMVVAADRCYLKSGDNPWLVQTLKSSSDDNDLVRALVGSVTGGNLEVLPLADMFGATMMPKDGILEQMNEKGLLGQLTDLGKKQIEGNELQGYQLVFVPEPFFYYFSNLGGSNPQAQGKVLDNVQSMGLVVNYWLSPDDQLIVATDFDLDITMKADSHTPFPSVFSLQMNQVLKNVNQEIHVEIPNLT